MPDRKPFETGPAGIRARVKKIGDGWFVWFLAGTSIGGALFWQ